VVPIELEDVDQWLFGAVEQAAGLVRIPGPPGQATASHGRLLNQNTDPGSLR